MTKFTINKNKPDLPEELINRHKDFSKLVDKHQNITQYKDATKPLYKNPGFMSFIIILSVLLLTFIITEKEKKEEVIKKDTTIPKKEVKIKAKPSFSDTSATGQFTPESKVIKRGN